LNRDSASKKLYQTFHCFQYSNPFSVYLSTRWMATPNETKRNSRRSDPSPATEHQPRFRSKKTLSNPSIQCGDNQPQRWAIVITRFLRPSSSSHHHHHRLARHTRPASAALGRRRSRMRRAGGMRGQGQQESGRR
jgi:hypothetical protein